MRQNFHLQTLSKMFNSFMCFQEGENVAKLEKADILELTVRHLHNLRRQTQITARSEQSYADRFKAGFRHCAAEVTNFLGGVDHHTSVHVLKHLNLCIKRLEIMPPTTQPIQPARQTPLSVHQAQSSAIAPHQQLPPPGHHQMNAVWQQNPIRPSSATDALPQGVVHNPNYRPISGYASDGPNECCYDVEDCDEDMTRVNTPPFSPKIEVLVDDAPVWRPW